MDIYKADAVMLTGCCSTVGAKLSNYSSHCQPMDDMVRQASEQASNTPYGVHTPGWRQKNDIYGNICATTTRALAMVGYPVFSKPWKQAETGYMPVRPGTQYAPGQFI